MTKTDTNAGIAASSRMRRYAPALLKPAATVASSPSVMIGPAMAPAVSMLRWKPKAFPRVSGGVDSVNRASRGASLTPFPVRSKIRIPRNSGQL